MRTYALKARVDNGPGSIGLEISMARALHVRQWEEGKNWLIMSRGTQTPHITNPNTHLQEGVKKVLVYIRPEGFPTPKDDEEGALDAVPIHDDGAPYFRAEAHGLSTDSVYACTFRLLFPDGHKYPRSDEEVAPLLGMPMPMQNSFSDEVRGDWMDWVWDCVGGCVLPSTKS